MTITVDWANKIVESTASITDIVLFHAALRELEASPAGVIHEVTHTWKVLPLDGGAFFYGCDLINGYRLKFPDTGSYTVTGNLGGTIIPVVGAYVERKTSAAYVTTAVGGSGPSAASIAAEVWALMFSSSQATPIDVNVKKVNDLTVTGSGTESDPWGPN